MRKFLITLFSLGLALSVTGCTIEIIDKEDTETEDTDKENANTEIKIETLQDALDILNADTGNCNTVMTMQMYSTLSNSEEVTYSEEMVITGAVDENITYSESQMEMYGEVMTSYQYVVVNTDGTTDTYSSSDNTTWFKETTDTEEDTDDEFNFTAAQFELKDGSYVTTETAVEELGVEVIITIADNKLTVEMIALFYDGPAFDENFEELFDEDGNAVNSKVYVSTKVEMSNFGKVTLTIPTV